MLKIKLGSSLLVAAAMWALSLSAQAQTPVKFSLNYLAGGASAGYALAYQLGLYKQAGLDVTMTEGKGSGITAQMTATGQFDVALADAPATMQLRSLGAPLKVIASPMEITTNAVMTLPDSGITTIKQLVGKKLAIEPGTAQAAMLPPILGANGVQPSQLTIVNLQGASLVTSLVAKQVDAIAAGSDFQGVQIIRLAGGMNAMMFADIGAPTVGISIIAREDKLKANPDLYRKFIAASLDGWDRARKDPRAAAEATGKMFQSASVDDIEKQLRQDVHFLCATGAATLGRTPDPIWQKQWELLTTYLNLSKAKPVSDYYDYSLIAEDAPKCP
jgi:NitT/TauT family transport system substrate-binding protein